MKQLVRSRHDACHWVSSETRSFFAAIVFSHKEVCHARSLHAGGLLDRRIRDLMCTCNEAVNVLKLAIDGRIFASS